MCGTFRCHTLAVTVAKCWRSVKGEWESGLFGIAMMLESQPLSKGDSDSGGHSQLKRRATMLLQ